LIDRTEEEAVGTVCIAVSRAVIVGKFNTRKRERERESKRTTVVEDQ
jgi:nicotinamide mononucleotide (NMN) deamidase PncC